MSYSIVERGRPNTKEYRIFYKGPNGNIISPFHDIPLHVPGQTNVFNMVVEIPRWTNAKMEISKDEKLNPIKQDIKKDKLRYVKNIFPHHGYIWNYGAFPQTWEDPNQKYEETNTAGDNDPLDVCEIGHKIPERGAVIQVKVLGTMLLIDEGETDWKIICIDVTDPLANKLNDIDDVEKEMPGFLKATYEWFRYYKVPDGKPENTVHWDGRCKNKEFALRVVEEIHGHWKNLMTNPSTAKDVSCTNVTGKGCPDTVSAEAALSFVETQTHADPSSLSGCSPHKRLKADDSCPVLGSPAPVDEEVNKWYYVIPQ